MSVSTDRDPLHNLWATTFFGQQAIQYPADLWLYENVLNDRAAEGAPIRAIIELGSGSGGLSLYLHLQARAREARFWTCDHFITPAATTPLGLLLDLGSRCITGDLWSGEIQSRLQAILDDPSNHPLLLLCDNGDKPREFKSFVPRLKPHDVVFVHDFHNEFDLPDIPEPLVEHLELLRGAESDALQLLTRAWLCL